MKHYFTMMLFLLSTAILADGLPGYLEIKAKERNDFQNSNVLYAGETFSVALNQNTLGTFRAEEFKRNDLYAARFINIEAVLPQLRNYGEILYTSPERSEVIMSLTDADKRDELAAFLHAFSGTFSCGSLLKLRSPHTLTRQLPDVQATEAEQLVKDLLNAPVDPKIKMMVDQVDSNNIREYVEKLSTFKNRYHRSTHGQQSADFIYRTFLGYAESKPAWSVEKFKHSDTPQPSIIARFKGTTSPNEIVIVGCHIDSINSRGFGAPEMIAPGADDNASGTAAVKELVRIFATGNQTFKRTIEFHGYAAEEIGLVGSDEIASEYREAGKKVVGMVQIDMNMFVRPGATPAICIVTNDTNRDHNNLAIQLVGQYASIRHITGQLFAGTSDHRSWTQQGYPTIFPTENVSAYNQSIHTTDDIFAESGNMVLAQNITKLALAYLASMAQPN